MELALIIVGCFGLLGMTWFFPFLGVVIEAFQGSKEAPQTGHDTNQRAETSSGSRCRELVVLIPAHNESSVIQQTLESVFRSIEVAARRFSGTRFRVLVGADGCSDGTAALAMEKGAEVLEFAAAQGKWLTLQKLLAAVPEADYVVFADSGVVWPETFLARALEAGGNHNVVAVAPTYRNPFAGRIEGLLWSIERHFKNIENNCGGPISIHGATVLYRRLELEQVLQTLAGAERLNDDVVIPLVLRAKNPAAQVLYLADTSVHDLPSAGLSGLKKGSEWKRRRRMVLGNAQWIRNELPAVWRENRTAAVLAMRRVFRLFWAWWLGCLAAALIFLLGRETSGAVFCLMVVLSLVAAWALSRRYFFVRRLVESAMASLIAPVYMLRPQGSAKEVVWQ